METTPENLWLGAVISIKRGMATCAELPMAPDRIDNALRAFWRGRTTPLARLIGEPPGESGVCSMLMALMTHVAPDPSAGSNSASARRFREHSCCENHCVVHLAARLKR